MVPKKELLRVILTPENEIVVDLQGKKNGRGAYLCKKEECLLKARKLKSLERSLSAPIPEEIYEEIAEVIKGLA